jgi:hypothetical protein
MDTKDKIASYKQLKEWPNLKNPTAEDVVTILREHSQARVTFAKQEFRGEWNELLLTAGEYNVTLNGYPSPGPTISKKLLDELLDAGLIELEDDWEGSTNYKLSESAK